MDLAYLTGQRPADVLRMDETHVRDDMLHIRQGKTGAKLRLSIWLSLPDVLARIRERKRGYKIYNTRLVVNEHGRPIGVHAIRVRWKAACKAAGVEGYQFRDLRAKAATDKAETTGDIRQAQKQLGHATVTMTETYTRNRRGDKVKQTR